jgi:hypothetical protein
MFVRAISSTIAFNFLIAGEWPGTKPVFLGSGRRSERDEVIIPDGQSKSPSSVTTV